MAKNIGRGNKVFRRATIPNVVGQNKTTAESTLSALGINYSTTDENTADNGLNNTIKSQSIPSGNVVALGTTINLVNYTFSFTPFGAFGFTPFGFVPVFGFAPVFGFSPSATPGFTFAPPGCIHEDTLISTPHGEKPAKEITIGEKIFSFEIKEISDNGTSGDFDYIDFVTPELTIIQPKLTEVTDIVPSTKNNLIYFNNENNKMFSLTQPMFVKRQEFYEIMPSGSIEIGDHLVSIENNSIKTILVESIDFSSEMSVVYQFSCEPEDWFIAGNYLVHNK